MKEEREYTEKYERWHAREKRYLEGEDTPLNIPAPRNLRELLSQRLIEIIESAKEYRLSSDGVTPVKLHEIGRGLADIWRLRG